jgi:CubicO group peptidase (beta-lactamase class C family)
VSKSAVYEAIDGYIERHMGRLSIPGAALGIVEGDTIVHLRGFGQARPGETPSPQTPFFVGSTTKSFTALAVMQLVEAGKIALDDPVQRYLPWFRVADPQASARISVRHLLNQTSGLPLLPGWAALADFDQGPGASERQARALSTLTLARPAGAAFEYSNTNYTLLGLIIEAASGESYGAYIRSHIFAPLDMRHSYTTRAEAAQDGLALGHRYWFATPIPAPDLPVPLGSLAAGQLISSAEDMAHYLIAQLNEGRYGDVQILSPAGIAELHRPAAAAVTMGAQAGQYAMGWYIEGRGRTRVLSHSGMVPDFYAYMALLPEQRKGLVLLFNANHFMGQLTLTEVAAGVGALLGGGLPAPLRFGAIPWALRGLPLIPALQVAGAALTLRRLRRWRRAPESRPCGGQQWARHILLPLLPNLLLALLLIPMRRGVGAFLRLFMPDASWIAVISGGFAAGWGCLRTGLILRALAAPAAPAGVKEAWQKRQRARGSACPVQSSERRSIAGGRTP